MKPAAAGSRKKSEIEKFKDGIDVQFSVSVPGKPKTGGNAPLEAPRLTLLVGGLDF